MRYKSTRVLRDHRLVFADTEAAGHAVDDPGSEHGISAIVGLHRRERLINRRAVRVHAISGNPRLTIDDHGRVRGKDDLAGVRVRDSAGFFQGQSADVIVRRFVCAFFEPLVHDPDVLSRIGLATHELLENILKYSTDGRTTTRVGLVREGTRQTFTIATTSAITAERRAGLEEIFCEMASAADADSYYQQTMVRARHRRHGSGLGLARIWAEAEMKLSVDFDGDSVTIRALANLADEDAS